MTYLLRLGEVTFPKPTGININMMPFIIGDQNSIPIEYRHYSALVNKCPFDSSELGKVGYLTVTEGLVQKGTTQRRPGIHTDGYKGTGWGTVWGGGNFNGKSIKGGLFLANTIDDSFRIWNVHIDEPGPLGNCDHLQELLPHPLMIKKNQLIWFTDRCPHESLALKETAYRQFFRFVTSNVTKWFSAHSTPNPLGIQPRCEIVHGSKFA